jgi:pimeloyl-ACP methyl ester carboxylesterase
MTAESTPASSPDTVVFVHGLWMTPRSWEKFAARYEQRGLQVLAPAWPGLEGEVEALRADPAPLAKLDAKQVIDNYERIIRRLDNPPIIIGHSLGGAMMQVLLDRGLGKAGVGISAALVKGVYDLPLSSLRAAMPPLRNPFNLGKATPMSPKQFHYAFANTLSREESDKLWERYCVPASNRVLFEIALGNFNRHAPTKVDFEKADRAPMLFIGNGSDHVVPAKATRHNAEKYTGEAIVAYKEFPGRPHFPGVAGWEAVADYAIEWAQNPRPTDAEATATAQEPTAAAS